MIPRGHLDDCHSLQNPAQPGLDALAGPALLLIRCLHSLSLPLPDFGARSSPPPASSRVSRNTLSGHHIAKPNRPRRFNDPQSSHHPRHPSVGLSSKDTASGTHRSGRHSPVPDGSIDGLSSLRWHDALAVARNEVMAIQVNLQCRLAYRIRTVALGLTRSAGHTVKFSSPTRRLGRWQVPLPRTIRLCPSLARWSAHMPCSRRMTRCRPVQQELHQSNLLAGADHTLPSENIDSLTS